MNVCVCIGLSVLFGGGQGVFGVPCAAYMAILFLLRVPLLFRTPGDLLGPNGMGVTSVMWTGEPAKGLLYLCSFLSPFAVSWEGGSRK